MSCQAIIRGNTVLFTATFYDPDGVVMTVGSANVVVSFMTANVPQLVTISMTAIGTTWKATWDSSVADTGTVYWHVVSAGQPAAADDGSFSITANAANVEA